MIFWGWILGPVGLLLSVPLTMTVRIVMEGSEETRWIALLMGPAPTVEAGGPRKPNVNLQSAKPTK
jgi:AI-2 transport protein TqsA